MPWIMILLLSMNMLFMFSNHPMSMGIIMIIQTLIMSIISGMMMKTFWMSYILLISMLSGMMVLFIYMSSTASNEKFKNNIKMWYMLIIIIMMSNLFLIFSNKMIIKNNYLSLGIKPFKGEEILLLNKIFNMENMYITIMIVMYLLYTMIVSTSLVNIFEGPMRKKF